MRSIYGESRKPRANNRGHCRKHYCAKGLQRPLLELGNPWIEFVWPIERPYVLLCLQNGPLQSEAGNGQRVRRRASKLPGHTRASRQDKRVQQSPSGDSWRIPLLPGPSRDPHRGRRHHSALIRPAARHLLSAAEKVTMCLPVAARMSDRDRSNPNATQRPQRHGPTVRKSCAH